VPADTPGDEQKGEELGQLLDQAHREVEEGPVLEQPRLEDGGGENAEDASVDEGEEDPLAGDGDSWGVVQEVGDRRHRDQEAAEQDHRRDEVDVAGEAGDDDREDPEQKTAHEGRPPAPAPNGGMRGVRSGDGGIEAQTSSLASRRT